MKEVDNPLRQTWGIRLPKLSELVLGSERKRVEGIRTRREN